MKASRSIESLHPEAMNSSTLNTNCDGKTQAKKDKRYAIHSH